MSKARCDVGGVMKNRKQGYCPVTLEPCLEEEASLMTPVQRRNLAKKLKTLGPPGTGSQRRSS